MGIPRNYADPGKRIVAYLIDGIIMGVVAGVISMVGIIPMAMGMAAAGVSDDPELMATGAIAGVGLFLLSMVAIVVIFFLYFVLQHSGKHQATFGKRAMKLYVTDMQGRRLTFGTAAIRFLGRIVNSFTMLIGYIMILFTEHKQGLHDIIAGTLVLDGLGDQDTPDEFEEFQNTYESTERYN